jgi:RNA polymerase sigma factor (sigma-70 family)
VRDSQPRPRELLTATDRLVAVARDRDRSAFAELFREFAPSVKRYVMSAGISGAQADELAQEILLTVWRRADTYDPARASAATWIFAIARNRRIDALRRERHPEVDLADPVLVPAAEPAPDAGIDPARSRETLLGALAELPEEQAKILHSAYFEDKSLATIAGDEAVPLGTVKSRVRLAMQRLRASLGGSR